jgi:hypothetical protein
MSMKALRLWFVTLLVFQMAAFAATHTRGGTFRQVLTGGPAPSSATDGVSLVDATGYTVTVSADAAQTITGGSLLCYYYACVDWNSASNVCATSRWTRCAELDITPSAGLRDPPGYDREVVVGWGRVMYVPNVTASGGTHVNVTIIARRNIP